MLYIATLAQMKLELGIADTRDDAALTQWLEGLQGRIDDFLDRRLLRAESIEEIHDGGEAFLYLKRFPVESVASIHISAEQEWTADSLLEATDYRLRKERGVLIYNGSAMMPWPGGYSAIRVVYTGGYVAAGTTPATGQTAMPDGLRGAFLMQAAFEWRNRNNLGVNQISAQGAAMNLAPAQFLPAVREGLQPYRRII